MKGLPFVDAAAHSATAPAMPTLAQRWHHGTVYGYQKKACRCDDCVTAFDTFNERYSPGQLTRREDARLAAIHRANGVPMGGTRRQLGRDAARPLICVCSNPDPEWVYVANQCRRCLRVIR